MNLRSAGALWGGPASSGGSRERLGRWLVSGPRPVTRRRPVTFGPPSIPGRVTSARSIFVRRRIKAVVVRWLVPLQLLTAIGCVAHPPAAAPGVRLPDGMRVVHLARAGDDQSCLDRRGGTFVPRDLPDAEVRAIEALIRQTDRMPITEMRFLEESARPRCAASYSPRPASRVAVL